MKYKQAPSDGSIFVLESLLDPTFTKMSYLFLQAQPSLHNDQVIGAVRTVNLCIVISTLSLSHSFKKNCENLQVLQYSKIKGWSRSKITLNQPVNLVLNPDSSTQSCLSGDLSPINS